jgi:hypothetical protein
MVFELDKKEINKFNDWKKQLLQIPIDVFADKF